MIDELTLKAQIASQRAMLQAMGDKEKLNAALARAEAAETLLARDRVTLERVAYERGDALSRLERAEAALAQCRHDLAAVPVDALRSIAERERFMFPPTAEMVALNAWLEAQP